VYRFGFNGKENDGEWTGSDTRHIQDYGFRLYNPAIGKFLSVDPLSPDYPFYTPYQFAGNKPIKFIDLDGLEEAPNNADVDMHNLERARRNIHNNFLPNLGEMNIITEIKEVPIMMRKPQLASNLFQVIWYSQQANTSGVKLYGQILNKVANDPAVSEYREGILSKIGYDPFYLSSGSTIIEDYGFKSFNTRGIGFGGERNQKVSMLRQGFDMITSPIRGAIEHRKTWEVAANELTWVIRNAGIRIDVSMHEDGRVDLHYKITDNLDLSSSDGRSKAYNGLSDGLGIWYHTILNAPVDFSVEAEWTESYDFNDINSRVHDGQKEFNKEIRKENLE
jgi:RHS repeat-associated protein